MRFSGALNNGKFYSKLSRPQNIIYSGLLSSISAYILTTSLTKALACYLLIFSLYGFAASFNNFNDIKTDKINKRLDNPLILNKINNNQIYLYYLIIFINIFLLQLILVQPYSLLITLLLIILAIAYSHKVINIQSRSWAGVILLAIDYGCLPLLLGSVQGSNNINKILILMVLQLFLIIPFLLAKDYKDLVGDKKTGKNTPLVIYGKKIVFKVSVIIALLAGLLFFNYVEFLRINKILSLILIILYIIYIIVLHYRSGKVSKIFRITLTFLMLSISLILVYKFLK